LIDGRRSLVSTHQPSVQRARERANFGRPGKFDVVARRLRAINPALTAPTAVAEFRNGTRILGRTQAGAGYDAVSLPALHLRISGDDPAFLPAAARFRSLCRVPPGPRRSGLLIFPPARGLSTPADDILRGWCAKNCATTKPGTRHPQTLFGRAGGVFAASTSTTLRPMAPACARRGRAQVIARRRLDACLCRTG